MSPARVPNLSPDDLHRLLPVVSQAEEIGSGGQKQVFKALLAGRTVVIKVLFPDPDADTSTVDAEASTVLLGGDASTVLDDEEAGSDPEDDLIPPRLRRELALLAAINTPAVVPLVEIDGKRLRALTERGKVYLAYAEAWIDGEDLNQRLARGTKTMPQGEVLRLALDAVTGIEAMWSREIVHRDIKPHNIIRRREGGFVLIDLGLALDLQADTITEAGGWLGTLPFAAPEINDPELRDRVDFRADEFSLGLVLYEALAAKHPYSARRGGKTVDDVRRKFRERPIPLIESAPSVDPELAAVIMRMIDTDMSLRYARLPQLESALRGIATRLGVLP
jgi:serine/threonine protein kinase